MIQGIGIIFNINWYLIQKTKMVIQSFLTKEVEIYVNFNHHFRFGYCINMFMFQKSVAGFQSVVRPIGNNVRPNQKARTPTSLNRIKLFLCLNLIEEVSIESTFDWYQIKPLSLDLVSSIKT